jgi:short subunit dehydrogenase-like uncharacterized protein
MSKTTSPAGPMKTQWLIYGANGYSAQLAIEKAVSQGLTPILAGRNQQVIEALAAKHGLQARVFDLSDVSHVADNLADVKMVSHCAGPFSATAETMMRACIQAGAHYTDITGEMGVFDTAQKLNAEATKAGVVLCPGVGFDVIPTDCMAGKLFEAMPDATHLVLGFSSDGALSQGTAKTSVEMLGEGMKIRRDGKIVTVGRGYEMRDIDFGKGAVLSSVIPWGDLSTAYWQTKIPNISVYMPHTGGRMGVIGFAVIKNLLKLKFVQNFAKKKIEQNITGPSKEQRDKDDTDVFGEVRNAAGARITGRLRVPNGYTVTMDGILITSKFLMGYNGDGGCQTPAQLMGTNLAEQLPGAGTFDISTAD